MTTAHEFVNLMTGRLAKEDSIMDWAHDHQHNHHGRLSLDVKVKHGIFKFQFGDNSECHIIRCGKVWIGEAYGLRE